MLEYCVLIGAGNWWCFEGRQGTCVYVLRCVMSEVINTIDSTLEKKEADDADSDCERRKDSDDEDDAGVRARRNRKRDLDDEEADKNPQDGRAGGAGSDQQANAAAAEAEDEEELKRRAKRAARFGDQVTVQPKEVKLPPPPVFKYTEGIDPTLPWSERKRLMVK
jgi:hypothetical protein